jgi:hypothetical protein
MLRNDTGGQRGRRWAGAAAVAMLAVVGIAGPAPAREDRAADIPEDIYPTGPALRLM